MLWHDVFVFSLSLPFALRNNDRKKNFAPDSYGELMNKLYLKYESFIAMKSKSTFNGSKTIVNIFINSNISKILSGRSLSTDLMIKYFSDILSKSKTINY